MKMFENYPDYLFEEAERRERELQDTIDLENKQSEKESQTPEELAQGT